MLLSEWYIWINRIMNKTIPVKTKHRRSLSPWVSSETSSQMKRHNTLLNKLIKKKADIANKACSSLGETSSINLESKVDASASALNERLQFDPEDYAEKTFAGRNFSDAFKYIKIVKEPQSCHLSSTGVKSQHRLTSKRRIFSTVFLLVFSCVTNHWFPVAGRNAWTNQCLVLLKKCQIFYRH